MATAGAAPGPAPPHRLASLPTDIHCSIRACLGNKEAYSLASTATAFVQPYGGRFDALRARNSGQTKNPAAFVRLLRRQEALEDLDVAGDPFVPCVVSALVETGCGRHLKRLDLPAGDLSILRLFESAPGPLPVLEDLVVFSKWPEPAGLQPLLIALAEGASPRLRELWLALNWEETRGVSEFVDRLASALEARQARGCAGLARLIVKYQHHHGPRVLKWQCNHGGLESYKRLWSIVLPTIEQLPYDELLGGTFCPFSEAILEHGAPCLKVAKLESRTAVVCLPALTALEELTLMDATRFGAENVSHALEELIMSTAASGSGAQPLLPALRRLTVPIEDMKKGKDLYAAMGRTSAFPGIETLKTFVPPFADPSVRGKSFVKPVVAALVTGAFASLQRLEFSCKMGSAGLKTLVQGILRAPCAQTLRSLSVSFSSIEDGKGFAALGKALSTGRLPAFVELDLSHNTFGDGAVEDLMDALAGTPGLEVLNMDGCEGVTDNGVAILAKALQEGRLGSRLKELRLGPWKEAAISDVGVRALAGAISGGGEHVALLETLCVQGGAGLTKEGRRELVEAAAARCPVLKLVLFSNFESNQNKKKELGLLNKIVWNGLPTKCRVMFKD